MTSQGAHINGLDAYKWISAGYACHIYGSRKRAYVRPGYEQREDLSTSVVDITSGTTVGFRYLQFGVNTAKSVSVVLEEAKKLKVLVRLDSYKGRVISVLDFTGSEKELTAELACGVIGKHAVYFEFLLQDPEETCIFDRFTFD
jgi:hypothetical protein